MTPLVTAILVGILCLVVGLLVGYALRKNIGEKEIGSAEAKAKNIILDAENNADNLKKKK